MNSHKKTSLIFILILIHIIFFSNFIIFILSKIFPKLFYSNNLAFLQIIGSCIFFLIPIIIYCLVKKLPLNKIFLLNKLSFKNILVIIFLSLVMQPFLSLINVITMTFAENEVAASILNIAKLPYWQVLLSVAIVPAILEELVFRGIFIKEYENCSFWYSIIFSALFFGMMHLTITQLFYTIVAGIIMGYLVKVTGSIWAGILSHFVLNGTQITISHFSIKALEKTSSMPLNDEILKYSDILSNSSFVGKIITVLSSSILFLFSLPFFILAIYLFKKVNIKNIEAIKLEDANKKQNNPKIFNVYFIIAIILYLGYFILKYFANKL